MEDFEEHEFILSVMGSCETFQLKKLNKNSVFFEVKKKVF